MNTDTENTNNEELGTAKPWQRIAAVIGLVIMLGLIIALITAIFKKSSPETFLILFASIIAVSIFTYALVIVKRNNKM